MSVLLTCTIPGTPQQQGSRRYLGNGRSIDMNANLKAWRADAITFLQRAMAGAWRPDGQPITDPVRVAVSFIYARPASHYGTGRNAHVLKASAPHWKASAPDLDKLQRALGDALTQAGVLRDDALIVGWQPEKVYGVWAETRLLVRTADPMPGWSIVDALAVENGEA